MTFFSNVLPRRFGAGMSKSKCWCGAQATVGGVCDDHGGILLKEWHRPKEKP